MEKKCNLWSFYLILICIGLAVYSLYSNINSKSTWLITPPNYVLLIMILSTLVLGMIGFKNRQNWCSITRSWITVTLSSLTAMVLFLGMAFTALFSSIAVNEPIKTINSPNGDYRIDFYYFDAGATGSFGVRGEIDGPLWFEKRIYYQEGIENVEVSWKSNDKVLINNHSLNLGEGETHGY
ncbi:DUF5412 family protein [Lentibacillus salicampi]|uniref:Uncharacterized protein n=1 Tax=Lentibacillus salicampi TaxID=175306 RepID=A0A4Y9A968_9BACI|nr:DUF5412 family protein [Lentibacillus salicampi]TFJ92353.1 hypothetical protein E4U82_12950 [Lentibacillus salicampi]